MNPAHCVLNLYDNVWIYSDPGRKNESGKVACEIEIYNHNYNYANIIIFIYKGENIKFIPILRNYVKLIKMAKGRLYQCATYDIGCANELGF